MTTATLTALPPAAAESALARRRADYAELRRQVRSAGLLELQPRYYSMKTAVLLATFAGTLALAALADGWLRLLMAVPVGVMFTQVGLLGHDFQHRQIVRRRDLVTYGGVLLGNMLIGISASWWAGKHNAHHGSPNQLGADPDIDFPMLVFAEEQIAEKPRVFRPLIAQQARLFFVLTAFQAANMRLEVIKHVLFGRPNHRWIELGTLIAHYVLFGVFLATFGWPMAIAFFLVSQATSGVYNGLVFAPNHKGMPMFGADEEVDFLTLQVLTSRNVRGHPLTDLAYGGLNYQIEHHLFPTMPRNNLHLAQPIVRDFCREHDLAYVESSVGGALRAIFGHLHRVSAPLRA